MIDAERYALIAILLLFTIGAAFSDWRAKRLPNVLTVTMAVAGLLFHISVGAYAGGLTGSLSGAFYSLCGFGVGFGLLFVVWAIGAGGGGDVKYTAALGSWLGASAIFYVIVVSLLIVIASSVAIMLFKFFRTGIIKTPKQDRGNQPTTRSTNPEQAQQELVRRRLMPWAVPTAFATWLVLAYQSFWLAQS